MNPLPGTTLAGRYRVERLLGEGGMGSVWAATHLVTRKPFALKLLKDEHAADPKTRQRFVREARAASAVRHPNVVEIHDIVELDDGTPLMVMELLLGETLSNRLDRQGRIPLVELAKLLLPVVSAVGTAHAAGIVHRDLKPDNIFLSETASGAMLVKVLDFGIAKLTAVEGEAAATAGLTGTGAMLGTPYYMAPEQIFGERDVDHRADIWALGIVLYECLSGTRPTHGENLGQILKIVTRGAFPPIEQVCADLPKEVTDLVGRMLSVDRHDRPASLAEVRSVLQRYADTSVMSFGDPSAPRQSFASIDSGKHVIRRAEEFEATVEAASLRTAGATLNSTTKDRAPLPKKSRGVAWLLAGAGVITIGAITFAVVPRSPAVTITATPLASSPPAVPAAPPPPLPSPAATLEILPSASIPVADLKPSPVKSARPKASAAPAASTTAAPQSTANMGGVVEKPPF